MNNFYYWNNNSDKSIEYKYNNYKYLCFKPKPGDYNSIRVSLELATCLAYLLNRVLVIPSEDELNLNNIFDLENCNINMISFDNFCYLKQIDPYIALKEKWENIKKISEIINWNLNNGLIYFDGSLDLDIIKNRTIFCFNNYQLLSPILFFNENLSGHFYLTIHTRKLGLLCHLIKNNIHYKPELFNNFNLIKSHLGKFYAIHIDQKYSKDTNMKTWINQIYLNIKNIIPLRSNLFIASSLLNSSEFYLLSKYYKLIFLNDIKYLLPPDINSILLQPIEQIICSQGQLFIGTESSIFSSYIYRLRGYQNKGNLDYLVHNKICLEDKEALKNKSFPSWKQNWVNNCGREYHESWTLAKDNNPTLNIQYFPLRHTSYQNNNIFVSIASYRDPELIPTIENLFQKAKNLNRIFLGICLQDTQYNINNFKYKNHPQVKLINIDYKLAKGCCYARSLIQKKLFRGERYFLQIDSHMRFRINWDETLISQLEDCPEPKPILSTYPNNYNIDDNKEKYLIHNKLQVIGIMNYNSNEYLNTKAVKTIKELSPQLWIAAGFIFTYSEWIKEVPYDYRLYFKGEEDSLTIRSYTYGWNIYCPLLAVIYHCYHDNRLGSSEKYRTLHYEDNFVNYNYHALSQLYKKINYKEIVIGPCRSISDFERFYGLNFKTKNVQEWASKGLNYYQFINNSNFEIIKKMNVSTNQFGYTNYKLIIPNIGIEESYLEEIVLYNGLDEEKLRINLIDSKLLTRINNQINIELKELNKISDPKQLLKCSICLKNNQNIFSQKIDFKVRLYDNYILPI